MDVQLGRHRAIQVAQSLNVIAEMPRYVDDPAWPDGLRVAALDAFFIHLRLLAEFFVKKPDACHPAIGRRDYATGFHLDTALRARLADAFDFASKHLAHLSIERAPTVSTPVDVRVDAARLHAHADDVFAAMHALVRHLRDAGSPYAAEFAAHLAEAESRADWRP